MAFAILTTRDPYADFYGGNGSALVISVQEEEFKIFWPRVELITTGYGNKTIGYHLLYKVQHL
jgi:hypothetical protein